MESLLGNVHDRQYSSLGQSDDLLHNEERKETPSKRMHTEDIMDAVGGMSTFQIILMFLILGPKILSSWGMLMMSFAGVAPKEWSCVENSGPFGNSSFGDKSCPAGENATMCSFVYSQEKDTVINEWDLICDDSGIAPTITAVQMGGVLIGSITAGQLADTFGRKKTYYLSMLLHAIFNLIAAFSVSWQMFMALRFFIGIVVGGLLCVYFTYYMEFVGQQWRPITGALPFWQAGSALFGLVAWLRPRWSDLHLILTAIHVPFLLSWFFVPESLRWLSIHGKLEEAEKVVDKMARVNRRAKPVDTYAILKTIAEEETKMRDSGHHYSYLDVYRPWNMCWRSLVMQLIWVLVSFVFYGISFGVGSLTGNLYLNIALIALVDVPGLGAFYFLSNRIGRRWTSFTLFAIAVVGAFGVALVTRVVDDEEARGIATRTLALVCRFGVASAWNCIQVMTTEMYPTGFRNLGYGAASMAARAGAIVSPYIFTVSKDDLLPPFLIVGGSMCVCGMLSLTIKETMGQPLPDSYSAVSTADTAEKQPPKEENVNTATEQTRC